MSYTIRGKTVGYCNIAQGAATGKERTITGTTGLAEVYPGGYGDSTVDSAMIANANITNIAQGVNTTDVNDENIGVAAVAPQVELLNSSNIDGMVS